MAKHEGNTTPPLRDLIQQTADLEPTDGLTDAVMQTVLSLDQTDPFERLAEKTKSIAPTDAFTDAIMLATAGAAQENVWLDGIARLARVALVTAAAAAAISLFLSRQAEGTFDQAILESIAAVEVDE